jgi:hypothetical protein
LIPKTRLKRLVDQSRQRHGERPNLVQGKPDGRRVAGGIDEAERNSPAVGGHLARRKGLGIDFHHQAPETYTLYPAEYIDTGDGV